MPDTKLEFWRNAAKVATKRAAALQEAASAFLTDVQSGADATRVSESGAALERLLRGETANG